MSYAASSGQSETQPPIDVRIGRMLRDAALDPLPVSGLTHNYYRYPARFSPRFARTAIEAFTEPGDLVVDPFMGGGTTLVEALSLGRWTLGCDISSLATFLSRVKTTLYSDAEIKNLGLWANALPRSISMHGYTVYPEKWVENGYLRNLNCRSNWRIRKATEQAVATVLNLTPERVEDLARCVILRTAQWALDARKTVPSIDDYRVRLVQLAHEMLCGAEQFRKAVDAASVSGVPPAAICINRSAIGLEHERAFCDLPKPKLFVTSPPYPGVHVLYHRWQVDGRKETPAPFWIANKLDGAGEKFYSMGSRRETELRSYYENLRAAFTSIRRLCDRSTTVVQMVAFNEPEWQLSKYLDVITGAGFTEVLLPEISESNDGRLWRRVPNRKWHAGQMGATSSCREVVLFHNPAMQPLQRSPIDDPRPHPTH